MHLDFPAEVARARFKSPEELKDFTTRASTAVPPGPTLAPAKWPRWSMIDKAQRPLMAGQGVFQRKGWDALMKVAEKGDIAVATSGPTRAPFR